MGRTGGGREYGPDAPIQHGPPSFVAPRWPIDGRLFANQAMLASMLAYECLQAMLASPVCVPLPPGIRASTFLCSRSGRTEEGHTCINRILACERLCDGRMLASPVAPASASAMAVTSFLGILGWERLCDGGRLSRGGRTAAAAHQHHLSWLDPRPQPATNSPRPARTGLYNKPGRGVACCRRLRRARCRRGGRSRRLGRFARSGSAHGPGCRPAAARPEDGCKHLYSFAGPCTNSRLQGPEPATRAQGGRRLSSCRPVPLLPVDGRPFVGG